MTNQLSEIKKVPFMGTELIAARDDDGQIWAGVRWICNGIGFNKGQTNSQVEKIKEDNVLCKGYGNFRIPTNGGFQETLALKLEFVPLWLAKISVTPKMKQESPELADRLIQYQLKAKDVLAEAFLPKQPKTIQSREELLAQACLAAHEVIEEQRLKIQEMQPKADYADAVKETVNSIHVGDLAQLVCKRGVNIGRNRLFDWFLDKGILRKEGREYKPYQKYMDMGIFEIKQGVVNVSKDKTITTHTVFVTGKGQTYLVDKIVKDFTNTERKEDELQ